MGCVVISCLATLMRRDHVFSSVHQSLKAPHSAALHCQMRFSCALTVAVPLSPSYTTIAALSSTFLAHYSPYDSYSIMSQSLFGCKSQVYPLHSLSYCSELIVALPIGRGLTARQQVSSSHKS